MTGFDAIGAQPIGAGKPAKAGARMFAALAGAYTLTGQSLSFVHFVATIQRIKIRVAKPVLYQVRQFLGLLGR